MNVSEDRTKSAVAKELERESHFLSAMQMNHDGYSNAAIAKQLGITENAVRSLLKNSK